MKPKLDELHAACPEIAPEILEEHLSRLDENYFDIFNSAQINEHLRALTRVSDAEPAVVLFDSAAGGAVTCTIISRDIPALFSLITGVLAAGGFNIISGEIFTYARDTPSASRRRIKPRMIIDRFTGILDENADPDGWSADFERHLREVLLLFDRGVPDSIEAARRRVNEMVAGRLAQLHLTDFPVLYPVTIDILPVDNITRLRVSTQDTPAFLFAMSSALALLGISIERVRIRTEAGWITDEIDVQDRHGNPISDPEQLNQIKFTVLLTKQFTYFLSHAPDPYSALCRFEQIAGNLIKNPGRGEWTRLLANPATMRDLARLLGASDFIWEDFIRLQYETLLPMLQPHVAGHRFAHKPNELRAALNEAVAPGADFEEQCRHLNAFKDREIFLIDLDHILNPDASTRSFAEILTNLAETVIQAAADIVFRHLAVKFGKPCTVAGLPTYWAVCGLGKFGGAAMGYASDIELLLVYSDSGHTAGERSVSNAEFFNRMTLMLAEKVRAKREGIFHIDLRLRPYGEDGPPACSLESFCRYYGPGGPAHAYERLTLVRLRAVAGNRSLGRRIERLRDEYVYVGQHPDWAELHKLRERQCEYKTSAMTRQPPGEADRYNAKFSPGALVDLEYDVQILQVMHAHRYPALRTPRIHEALNALAELGVLTAGESRDLTDAYYFLRRLINGLRMLRGSARDLCLPPDHTPEFAHLARRMGYRLARDLMPEQQLRLDFETQTAIVRAFVERHFGREALPGPPVGNLADLVLSDNIPAVLSEKILRTAGFRNYRRAATNFHLMSGVGVRRTAFARLAVLAGDTLKHSADPDMALNNWERFIQSLPDPARHYALLLSQPRRLDILLDIFAASQFLADTLIRNPEFLDWVTSPAVFNATRSMADIEDGLRDFIAASSGNWPNAMRRFRRREILRTGARDICLHAPFEETTADITALAEAIIRLALNSFFFEQNGKADVSCKFCVLAFGKLGGRELNYSSDIDLLGVCSAADAKDEYNLAMRRIAANLAGHTEEGYAYRVDFRLRPFGSAGLLVYPLSALLDYYRCDAADWEVQALLKARPVAGNQELGRQFMRGIRTILLAPRQPDRVFDCIERLRRTACRQITAAGGDLHRDVKQGVGGIRDVEFLLQGLQLVHSHRHPELLTGNTMEGLALLAQAEIITLETAESLRESYAFLRRIEHCLQLYDDRQVHTVPADTDEVTALARRVLGSRCSVDEFNSRLHQCMASVQETARSIRSLE